MHMGTERVELEPLDVAGCAGACEMEACDC